MPGPSVRSVPECPQALGSLTVMLDCCRANKNMFAKTAFLTLVSLWNLLPGQTLYETVLVESSRPRTTRPVLRGTSYAVSSMEPLATNAAERILNSGGNAFDA